VANRLDDFRRHLRRSVRALRVMRKDVKITIEGKLGTGKSTIADVIAQALKAQGYNVDQATPHGQVAARAKELSLRTAEETIVTIDERQLPRVP
jgi:cytidylate kinase